MFLCPWACLCKLGLGRSIVCFTWGSHSGPPTFLCSIFAGFPFQVFQPPPFWTLSPYSNYLTKTLNLGERDLFYNYDPYYREQYHWLNGHEFEQTSGDSKGQGSLECCSPWNGLDWKSRTWLSDWTHNSVKRILNHSLSSYIIPSVFANWNACLYDLKSFS